MKGRYEVAVIGAGFAGLAAALMLARARRSVTVLDSGKPRNAASPGVHGFLSRDGTPPAELKRLARAEISGYGSVDFMDARVSRIVPTYAPAEFVLYPTSGPPIAARYVLLSTGMIDVLPQIDGFAEHWGRNVIHCPYCHGWENLGRRWGAFVNSVEESERVVELRNWTDDLLVFPRADLSLPGRTLKTWRKLGIGVERRSIARIVGTANSELGAAELDDGTRIPLGTIVCAPQQKQVDIVLRSGVRLDDDGRVMVDEHYQTSVPGLFAGGDIVPGSQTAPSAAAAGATIGRQLSYLLAQQGLVAGSSPRPQSGQTVHGRDARAITQRKTSVEISQA